jgi:hypothetical protein
VYYFDGLSVILLSVVLLKVVALTSFEPDECVMMKKRDIFKTFELIITVAGLNVNKTLLGFILH